MELALLEYVQNFDLPYTMAFSVLSSSNARQDIISAIWDLWDRVCVMYWFMTLVNVWSNEVVRHAPDKLLEEKFYWRRLVIWENFEGDLG